MSDVFFVFLSLLSGERISIEQKENGLRPG